MMQKDPNGSIRYIIKKRIALNRTKYCNKLPLFETLDSVTTKYSNVKIKANSPKRNMVFFN